jgi:hypothetical protein
MINIMDAFRDNAHAPETFNNYAEEIVLGATVRNVVAQAARHPPFVHPICNTYIHNSEIYVVMVDLKKNHFLCSW